MNEIVIDPAELFEDLAAEAWQIMQSKNKDYRGGSEDCYANFRLTTLLGVAPETGLLVRMLDKHQRLRAFIANGSLAVQGESVKDAILDCFNYTILLAGMLYSKEPDLSNLQMIRDAIACEASYLAEACWAHSCVEARLQSVESWMVSRQYGEGIIAHATPLMHYTNSYRVILEGRA